MTISGYLILTEYILINTMKMLCGERGVILYLQWRNCHVVVVFSSVNDMKAKLYNRCLCCCCFFVCSYYSTYCTPSNRVCKLVKNKSKKENHVFYLIMPCFILISAFFHSSLLNCGDHLCLQCTKKTSVQYNR